MKYVTSIIAMWSVSSAVILAADASTPVLVDVRRIWDKAPHNAFTDLVRFNDRWYCVFREGKGHVSSDGALRVITSADGQQWESAALLTSDNSDLRDAKITVTPDGRLMLSGAEAMNRPVDYKHRSLTWFSDDGRNWGPRHEVGDRDFWLWRTTWHNDSTYGFGYGTRSDNRSVRLYTSKDGKTFGTLIRNVLDEGYPNETSIVFLPDDTAYCLLRRDGQPNTAQLGRARPPYSEWTWKDLGIRIGGPHMVRLPDGRFVAAVRRYDGGARTSLHWLNPEKATLDEFLRLPSGGDTSYAGLAWHDGLLWISYYSSHEEKTSIYLARVRLGTAQK